MTRTEVAEQVGKFLAAFELVAERDGRELGPDIPEHIKQACNVLVSTFVDDLTPRPREPKQRKLAARRTTKRTARRGGS